MLPSHLVPCPGCSRHVRALEDACPFCRTALSDAVRAAPPPPRIFARLSRARLIAAGATAVALASSACGGDSEPTTTPFYGIAIGDYDAATDSQAADAGFDAARLDAAADGSLDASPPMFDASYGGPPLDSGSDATDVADAATDAADGD